MWTSGSQSCSFYVLVFCGTTSYMHGGVTQVCCPALRNRNTGFVSTLDLAEHLFVRNPCNCRKRAEPNLN
jgi:hypothetical protein